MEEPSPLSFRLAVSGEGSAIAALVKSAYRGHSSRRGWTTEADLLDDDRIDAAGVEAKIEKSDGVVILAIDCKDKLAACCEVVKGDADLAYFGLFAVDPTRQTRGIGKRLMAEAESYAARAFKVKKLEIHVIWSREDLISWYLRRGYTKLEETRPFPYHLLVNGNALVDDIHFSVLMKDL